MNTKTKGKFIVSLDFELLWGMHDRETKETFSEDIVGARNSIKKLLSYFDEYGIHATWATVGLLMAENAEDARFYSPDVKPKYENPALSAYTYFETLGNGEGEDISHYGCSLISEILNYKNQEIGSHTFSHYYCKEKGQTIEAFEADLIAAKKIAKEKFQLELKSLVLPRNQFDEKYVEVAYRQGFLSVRGNQVHFAYNQSDLVSRALRLLDTYTNLCGKKAFL